MKRKLLKSAALTIALMSGITAMAEIPSELMLPVKPKNTEKIIKAPRAVTLPGKSIKGLVPLTDFKGVLIGSSDWQGGDHQIGLYNFSATEPKRELVYQNVDMGSTYGSLIYENKLYSLIYFELFGTPFTSANLFDLSTGKLIAFQDKLNKNLCATSMAYEPSTGRIYGCFLNESHTAHEFGMLDLNTLTRNTISTLPGYLYGLSFTPEGKLVGLNPSTGNLYTVNTTTGQLTLIGKTGLKSKYASSGGICPKTGRMYFATCNDEGSALYIIDTKTAKATLAYEFPDDAEIMAINIPMPPFADNVPGAGLKLDADFEGINLSGSIKIQAPALTYDQSAGEGSLTYTLKCNDAVISSGAIEWNEEKEIPYEIESPAYCAFSLTFSNEDGEGPTINKSLFIGESYKPATVESVTFTLEGETQKICWTPVTALYYGGEFDASKLSYDVVRNIDNKKVATGLTSTEYSDNLASPAGQKELAYSVIPVYNGEEGDATVSESVIYGYLVAPFKETCAKARAPYIKTWTVVDADGDGVLNWTHDSSGGRLRTKATASSRDIYASPQIWFEADKVYTVKYGISSYSSSKTAHVSCYLSDSLEPDSFTRCLTEAEAISTASKTEYHYFTADFNVEKDGFYYLGFKNEGGTGTYNYLKNIEVTSPASNLAPAAPTELTATSDIDGSRKVEIRFTAPKLTAGGETLETISAIEVKRGNTRIARLTDNILPGETYTLTDTPESDGITEYNVAAINNAGTGINARVTIFVGINVPNVVSDLTITETEEGMVTLTWKAPTTDRDGYPINTKHVRYNILSSDRVAEVSNITETSCKLRAMPEGNAAFKYYYVQTLSDAGASEYMVSTDLLAVGTPFRMPYEESFANGQATTQWANINYSPTIPSAWMVVNEVPEFPSADNDGGFVLSHSDDAGGKIGLTSLKLKLDCQYPALSFYYYAIPGSENTIEARVANENGEFKSKYTATVSETKRLGWEKVIVPLDEYAGKIVRIEIIANCVNNSQTHFDAIRIGNLPECDLAIANVSVPESAKTWKQNEFVVKVNNKGRKAVNGAEVKLIANGETIAHENLDEIPLDGSLELTLTHQPGVFDEGKVEYFASVIADNDGDLSNNESEVMSLSIEHPDFPRVEGIAHNMLDSGIKLTWNAPDLSAVEPIDGKEFQLEGYNIYRDKVLIASSKTAEVVDEECKEGESYDYHITALYNHGESALSDKYTVAVSGIDELEINGTAVIATEGMIHIYNALGSTATIVTLDGRSISNYINSNRFSIRIASGVYLVSINNKTYKVIVK